MLISDVDVSEVERRRRELEQSHDLLQSLMDSLPDLVAVKGNDDRYLFVIRVFEQWFGVPREMAIGKRLLVDEEGRRLARLDAEVARRGERRSAEMEIAYPDGVTRPVTKVSIPILDAAGESRALAVVNVDNTEKWQQERAREQLLNATEGLEEWLAVFDAEDRFVACNNQFHELTRIAASHLESGRPFAEILRLSLPDVAAAEPDTDSEGWLAEGLARHRDPGETLYYHHVGRDIAIREARLPEGGIVIAVRDVTKQRRREAQLRQAQKMEAVGQLTGGVAHDFNNLLAIVQGNITLLDSRVGATSPLKELTAPALRAVRRGASLTHRLLAFSRRQTLDVQAVDVESLFDGLDDLLRRALGEDIALDVDVRPGTWPCAADEGLLEQAIVNLANNARDAMPAGASSSKSPTPTRISANSARTTAGTSSPSPFPTAASACRRASRNRSSSVLHQGYRSGHRSRTFHGLWFGNYMRRAK